MTVVCNVCKELLISREAAFHFLLDQAAVNPVSLSGTGCEANQLAVDLMNFDLLAGTLTQHMIGRHPEEAAQISAIMFLCGKLFATRWGMSTAANFETLRETWAAAILKELQPAAPAPASSSPAGSSKPC